MVQENRRNTKTDYREIVERVCGRLCVSVSERARVKCEAICMCAHVVARSMLQFAQSYVSPK